MILVVKFHRLTKLSYGGGAAGFSGLEKCQRSLIESFANCKHTFK